MNWKLQLFVGLCVLGGLVESAFAAVPIYRGFEAVETTLSERLLQEGREFSFSELYLTSSDEKEGERVNTYALMGLLGVYDGYSGNNGFRNGDPNTLNMLLWQVLLQLTAKDVAHYCTRNGRLPFNVFFQAVLDPLCAWPAASAKTENNLKNLWLAVMGYSAPEEEFLAWQQFALTSSLAEKPAIEALPSLFFLIVYNPHFLLRK